MVGRDSIGSWVIMLKSIKKQRSYCKAQVPEKQKCEMKPPVVFNTRWVLIPVTCTVLDLAFLTWWGWIGDKPENKVNKTTRQKTDLPSKVKSWSSWKGDIEGGILEPTWLKFRRGPHQEDVILHLIVYMSTYVHTHTHTHSCVLTLKYNRNPLNNVWIIKTMKAFNKPLLKFYNFYS